MDAGHPGHVFSRAGALGHDSTHAAAVWSGRPESAAASHNPTSSEHVEPDPVSALPARIRSATRSGNVRRAPIVAARGNPAASSARNLSSRTAPPAGEEAADNPDVSPIVCRTPGASGSERSAG
jgi:hypothetical protein